MRTATPLLAVLAVLVAAPARAEGPVTLKLATLAPTGSAWHELLRELESRLAATKERP